MTCSLSHVKLEHFSVRRGREMIVDDVSLALNCGQLTALIGANGAGKTTLIRALLGEIPFEGTVQFLNHDGHRLDRKPKIGYVPQQLEFDRSMPMTVMDFLLAARSKMPVWLAHSPKKKAALLEALARVDCSDLADRRLGDLSGGELQRVLLALALDPLPDLLILDEPVSGVDIRGLEIFYGCIDHLRAQYHLSILLVTHDMTLVKEHADQVALLGRRLLAWGAPEEVISQPEFREAFQSGENA